VRLWTNCAAAGAAVADDALRRDQGPAGAGRALVKDPETAQLAGFLPIFPLIFASSAFIPVKTMPSWLQSFANVQPVSVTINAVRALTAVTQIATIDRETIEERTGTMPDWLMAQVDAGLGRALALDHL
jgi:hypothetical protein